MKKELFQIVVFDHNRKEVHSEIKAFADIESAELYAIRTQEYICPRGSYYATYLFKRRLA